MTKNRLIIITMVSMILLLPAAFVSAEGERVIVTIEGAVFSPEAVTVKAGAEVLWKNKDSMLHTVVAEDGSFNSGPLSEGAEYARKFMIPGTFRYSCEMHPFMSGSVEVK